MLKKEAKAGKMIAVFVTGLQYFYGIGMKKDKKLAKSILFRAKNSGFV